MRFYSVSHFDRWGKGGEKLVLGFLDFTDDGLLKMWKCGVFL